MQYGSLSLDPARYPLYAVRTKSWDQTKPTVLITGGVHGSVFPSSPIDIHTGAVCDISCKPAVRWNPLPFMPVLPCNVTLCPTALCTDERYETSGVQGALLFLSTEALRYAEHFNILCCPCVSPWSYETVQRWNNNAEDPNRGFKEDVRLFFSGFFQDVGFCVLVTSSAT